MFIIETLASVITSEVLLFQIIKPVNPILVSTVNSFLRISLFVFYQLLI